MLSSGPPSSCHRHASCSAIPRRQQSSTVSRPPPCQHGLCHVAWVVYVCAQLRLILVERRGGGKHYVACVQRAGVVAFVTTWRRVWAATRPWVRVHSHHRPVRGAAAQESGTWAGMYVVVCLVAARAVIDAPDLLCPRLAGVERTACCRFSAVASGDASPGAVGLAAW